MDPEFDDGNQEVAEGSEHISVGTVLGEEVCESSEDDGFELSPATKALQQHDLEEVSKSRSTTASNIDGEMTAAVNREWENLVSSCRVPISAGALVLPWETGFASRVLNRTSPFPKLALPVIRFVPLSSSSTSQIQPQDEGRKELEARVATVPGAWKVIAARLGNVKFHVTEESKRQVALAKWRKILLIGPEHCRLGRRLLTELLTFCGDGHLISILQDVFAKKSTATMSKRADHILEYFSYCNRSHKPPLPFSEPLFYQFLREVRAHKAPTAAKSSKESVAFSELYGFDGADQILESERIVGLCHRLEITKRPTKRARVLSRKQVVALERTLMNPLAWLPDRVKAGQDLLCIFGRLRWRDSQWLSSAKIDGGSDGSGYLECETLITKTSTTALKKTSFLPVVVPLQLLETSNWASKWLELRSRASLPDIGSRNDDGSAIPALPSVDKSGRFTDRPLSATAAGKWTREIIKNGLDGTGEDTEGQTSHALKATTLSWVAKHGSMQTYERKLLGYHIDQAEGTMHCYSRDVVSAPMRKYQAVLGDVASGIFNPDETRSGHFKTSAPPNAEMMELLSEVASRKEAEDDSGFHVVDSADSGSKELVEPPSKRTREEPGEEKGEELFEEVSSSDSDSDGSSSADSAEDILLGDLIKFGSPESLRVKRAATALCDLRFVHSRLKTLHSGHSSNVLKLACGRALHAGYRVVSETDDFPYPRCTNCFGAK